jgi:glucose/arabinose dehydrogenase
MKLWTALAAGVAFVGLGSALSAQNTPPPAATPAPAAPAQRQGPPPTPALGEGPWDLQTQEAKLHVEVVARGLDHPWGMALLPDGGMLVTERPGRLRLIRNGVLDPAPIEGMLPIYATGIAGLTDVLLDPNFATNHYIYLAYSKPSPETPPGTNPNVADAAAAVMRAKWDGGHQLTEVKDIWASPEWYGKPPLPTRCCGQGPASGSFGGRLATDGRYLFITSGDRNYGERVQDPKSDFGKILRLNFDGSVPRDNPWAGKRDMNPAVWSTGHRNQLGLFFDAPTGRLWESEFGPRGGDEINVITKGGNYGWIDVTQGHHYNGEATHKGVREVEGFIDPVWAFPPSGNPGNIAIYRGSMFPAWQGNILLPNMSRPSSLLRMVLAPDGHAIGMERMLENLGQRFRDVRVGPDGAVYLLTDETGGAVLKITLAPAG